jgi:hypothetical protein
VAAAGRSMAVPGQMQLLLPAPCVCAPVVPFMYWCDTSLMLCGEVPPWQSQSCAADVTPLCCGRDFLGETRWVE